MSIDWLSQPVGLVTALLLVSFVLMLRPHAASVVSRIAVGASIAVLWLAAAPVPSNALLSRLELQRTGDPGCEASNTNSPLVVPAGGMNAWRDSDSPYEILEADSQVRTQGAADRVDEDTPIFLLGGGTNDRSSAEQMSQLLRDRGISPDRIIVEINSNNTRANAQALVQLLPPASFPDIRLVTSALHLRRASQTFERAGFDVCGIGVGSLNSPAIGLPAWLPWQPALGRSTHAWRELLATLADMIR